MCAIFCDERNWNDFSVKAAGSGVGAPETFSRALSTMRCVVSIAQVAVGLDTRQNSRGWAGIVSDDYYPKTLRLPPLTFIHAVLRSNASLLSIWTQCMLLRLSQRMPIVILTALSCPRRSLHLVLTSAFSPMARPVGKIF